MRQRELNENHQGCKKVTASCTLSSLCFILKPRLIQITSHICYHLNSKWILERVQAIFLCHEQLVMQQALDLVQKVETGDWHDSDPIREQNRPLDWLEVFHFISKTKLSQVYSTFGYILTLLLSTQHHEEIKEVILLKVIKDFISFSKMDQFQHFFAESCFCLIQICFKLNQIV